MKKLSRIASEGKIDVDASLTDRQSIIINAPIKEVWERLVDPGKWPSWHDQINSVVVDPTDPKTFKWQQKGRRITSSFEYLTAPTGLSWTAKSGWTQSIYLWTLDATEEDQTIVTVQQSYQGLLLFLFVSHRKMHNDLLHWLDQLKQVAETDSTLV
ncbi:MAG: SRPBCC family protein [Bacteroidota bacterium]